MSAWLSVRLIGGIIAALLLTAGVSCARSGVVMDVSTAPTSESATPSIEPDETGWLISADGTYRVSFTVEGGVIPLNDPFDLRVTIMDRALNAPATAIRFDIDARMPEHRHGMNLEPFIEEIAPGQFRVEDMLFHMPGRWELYFDITRDGFTERAWREVVLE